MDFSPTCFGGCVLSPVLERVYDSSSRPENTQMRSVRQRTKPTAVDLYEVFCGVLYLPRTGCQWRFLPAEFPKWQTVYSYFVNWSKPGQDGVSVLEQALKKSG